MTDRRPSLELRELRYQRLWGRRSAQIFRQSDDEDPHVDIYRHDPRGSAERIELYALTREIREAAPGRDAVAWALHTLAHMPWREQITFMPLETISWGGPLLRAPARGAGRLDRARRPIPGGRRSATVRLR